MKDVPAQRMTASQNHDENAPNYYMDQFYYQRDDWLYIRIPKCASSSVREALECEDDFYSIEDIDFGKVKNAFAVVRDPFTRALSCWRDRIIRNKRRLDTNPELSQYRYYTQKHFKGFIKAICQIPDDKADQHFRSQAWFIKAVTPNVPTLCIPLERLRKDWHLVEEIVMKPHWSPHELPHVRPAGPGPGALAFGEIGYYDDEMKGWMYQRYKEDFEVFKHQGYHLTKKRAMFIGRWQPLHYGHMWLIGQKLAKNIPVLIAVRDIPPDERNPFTTEQTVHMLETVYAQADVKVITIPDIESVNYGLGRGQTPGYEINEFTPCGEFSFISATAIRQQIREGKDRWKEAVDERIHTAVKNILQ